MKLLLFWHLEKIEILMEFIINLKKILKINYNNLYPLTLIGDIISAFFWILGVQLTIYWFTPCHFIISQSGSQILSTFISNSLENYSIYTKIIVIFFLL